MKIRIIQHFSNETGLFSGYELQYRKFWFWPFWRSFKRAWYDDRERLEHDIVFALTLDGNITEKKECD